MDACTITAPDVITAFAVPNPNHSSQSCRFFQVWRPAGRPAKPITQSTSDWLILIEPTLSIVDIAEVKLLADRCQCRFSVQTLHRVRHHYELKNRSGCAVCREWNSTGYVLHKLSTIFRPKTVPEAFPIKASDNPGVGQVWQRGITLRSVADGVRSVPPTLCIVVGWRFLRYDRFLRKADCGTQL